jgi:hypothetical protein
MRHRRMLIIVGVIGLAVLTGGLLAAQTGGDRAEAMTVSVVSNTITIDPYGGATFAPPPPNAAPAMTAEQAWAQFMEQSGSSHTTIPVSVTVQMGLFTLPFGPDCGAECSKLTVQNGIAYTVLNQLAYGYSWPSTCSYGNDTHPQTDRPCTEWIFLDANTGHRTVWSDQLQT